MRGGGLHLFANGSGHLWELAPHGPRHHHQALGRQLARNVGKLDEEVVAHLRQRLGILLVRDNVAMLCARTPTFPAAAVDGEDYS